MPQIEYKYNRFYVLVNPNSAAGPDTWRTATPDSISGGGGSGGGIAYDFDGKAPIDVTTTPPVGGTGPTVVETSMDLQQLDDRAK